MGIDVMKGSESWIAFAEEVDFNEGLDAVSPQYAWLMMLGESVKLDKEEKSPDYITGGREEIVSKIFGGGVSGDIEFNPDVDSLPWFLKWGLGALTSTQDGVSSAYSHEAKILSGASLRTFKIFKNVGGLPSAPLLLQDSACKINTLELEIVKQDWLKGKIGINGRDEADGTDVSGTRTTPGIFKLPVYDNCTAKTAPVGTTDFSAISAADDIETAKLILDNNLSTDDIIMDGTGKPRSIPEGKANVTIDLSSRDTSKTEYNRFKNGTEFALSIIADTGVLIDSGVSALTYGLEIIFPRCRLRQLPVKHLRERAAHKQLNHQGASGHNRRIPCKGSCCKRSGQLP
ncbi:MAG: phage tail tube protein [Candidatus Methanoperedens sp.]|nr:phage tail tube protein [Candidatus Methanoperedens sp.]